jgi:hypothetical protein
MGAPRLLVMASEPWTTPPSSEAVTTGVPLREMMTLPPAPKEMPLPGLSAAA